MVKVPHLSLSFSLSIKVDHSGKAIPQTLRVHEALQETESFTFDSNQSCNRFSLSALLITETELNVIAALAIIGLSNKPKKG